MPRYTVNRGEGYPPMHEGRSKYDLGETFESDDPQCEIDVEKGYLIRVEEPKRFTKEARPSLAKADPAED